MWILIPDYKPGVTITQEQWLRINLRTREAIANSFINNDGVVRELIQLWKTDNFHKEKETESWTAAYSANPTRIIQESKPFCNQTIPETCGKGKKLRHGLHVFFFISIQKSKNRLRDA